MKNEMWTLVLVVALLVNAAIGLAYRAYRYSKGGPIADVWGQSVLALLLGAVAIGLANDVDWLRWVALAYAAIYAVVAMPVWILGVLIPLPPRAIDYSFTVVYYAGLLLIAVAAIAY